MTDPRTTGWLSPLLLTIGLLLAFELLVLGDGGPWERVLSRIEPIHHLEAGVVRARVELAAARTSPKPRVFVIGSSQANAGFLIEALPATLREAASFHKIAYGGLKTLELRTLADELVPREPAVVVLFLSGLDTHSPLQIVPHGSFGSLPALVDGLRGLSIADVWRRRTIHLRRFAEGLSRSYRYRLALQRAGLARLVRFRSDARFPRPAPDPGRRRWNLLEGHPEPVSLEALAARRGEARRTLPADLDPRQIDVGIGQVRAATRGPQVAHHRRLARRMVARWTGAGSRVLLVEPPLHPVARELAVPEMRDDFLAFAETLSGDVLVSFLPTEESGPFAAAEFRDLTHLDRAGALRLTRAVASRLATLVDPVPRATEALSAEARPGDLPMPSTLPPAALAPFVGTTRPTEILLNLALATVLGLSIASLYRSTHKGLSYSQSFTQTIVFVTLVTALVMMVIGNSLTRAFALVGALSIIRFRTVVKDTKDTSYVFMGLAAGMGAGTSSYFLALAGTGVFTIVSTALFRSDFGSVAQHELILRLTLDRGASQEHLARTIEGLVRDSRLLHVEPSLDGLHLRLTYDVRLGRVRGEELAASLGDLEHVSEVSLVASRQDIDY